MEQDILTVYQKQESELKQELDHLIRSINRFSISRLLVIILGGALIFRVVQTENVWGALCAFVVVFIGFFWLVSKQAAYSRERKRIEDDLLVVRNELNGLAGKTGIYEDGSEFIDDSHFYSSDLDIFGTQSIYHKINRSATKQGKVILAGWLTKAADRSTIEARQKAVKELAADPLWCLTFLGRLVFALKEKRDFKEIFVRYLNKPADDFVSSLMKVYVKLSPWLMLSILILWYFISDVFGKMILPFLVFNNLLVGVNQKRIAPLIDGVDQLGSILNHFSLAFSAIENRQWKSEIMENMQLTKNNERNSSRVSDSILQLGKLINKLDYRRNQLLGGVLNGIFLWDFRQVFALIRWKRAHQEGLGEIFDQLGEVEALVGIAMLRLNQPDWHWPHIAKASTHTLMVEEMGHPLLSASISVLNSYALENHHIALITGSNMAGKSTFLRTIGANMVLAFAGAPVCAKAMTVSVMHVITYMRIKDSLKESTSTFKAELNRLEMILKEVSTDKHAFFLVDEMLRGTNSVDKYLGSKAIIEKLITEEGVGILATHDLQLASLEETYPHYLKNYHFDIQVVDNEMLFDYKLKEGACTIFNASILLRKIGINIVAQ